MSPDCTATRRSCSGSCRCSHASIQMSPCSSQRRCRRRSIHSLAGRRLSKRGVVRFGGCAMPPRHPRAGCQGVSRGPGVRGGGVSDGRRSERALVRTGADRGPAARLAMRRRSAQHAGVSRAVAVIQRAHRPQGGLEAPRRIVVRLLERKGELVRPRRGETQAAVPNARAPALRARRLPGCGSCALRRDKRQAGSRRDARHASSRSAAP